MKEKRKFEAIKYQDVTIHDTVMKAISRETRNAMRRNNRDDLLYLSFTFKISIFSEA